MIPILKDISLMTDPKLDSYDNCLKVLNEYNMKQTVDHVKKVASMAVRLASDFNEDLERAETAGILHDLGVVIPNDRRIWACEDLGIELCEEEKKFPMLIHQKLSAAMAHLFFGLNDSAILSAVSCHTTLKKNPAPLDMILFLADKISWDQEGEPPYLSIIEKGLEISLEQGAFNFINYLMKNERKLAVVHPQLREAQTFFKGFLPD
jgi:predicted HD superfamily hydrolase involved in NAD metabolism